MVHHDLAALPVGHLIAGVGIQHPKHDIRGARVEHERIAIATGAGNRLREDHRAAENHRDRGIREDLAKQIQRVGVDMGAAEQDIADLLVHQVHDVIVAGEGFEQRRSGVQIRDVLGAQNVTGLLDYVFDVGQHVGGGVAGSELFDPARIQIDRVEDRAESRRDQAGEVAHPVRSAGHKAQEAAAGRNPPAVKSSVCHRTTCSIQSGICTVRFGAPSCRRTRRSAAAAAVTHTRVESGPPRAQCAVR
ncbi:hypothetical protein I552_7839 [Mycobacterium xenopi 3993]|nr:hypothetical protein I552_7839 [Mycobacterium xenopi 3993]